MPMTPVHGFHADVGCVASALHGRFHEQVLHEATEFLSRADFAELCICALAAPLVMMMMVRQKHSCSAWFYQLQVSYCAALPSNRAAKAGSKASDKACEQESSSRSGARPSPLPSPPGDLLGALAGLPRELRCEVSQWLPLSDLAAAAAAGSGPLRSLWEEADIWVGLAEQHGCSAALAAAGAEAPVGTGAHATAMREAFRKAAFRTNGSGLLALFGGPMPPQLGDFTPLFKEAAHVLSGLMPADGGLAVKWLCEILSPGLRSYDATSARMAATAESLLQVARRRQDILTKAQIERLVAENGHAVDLARLLSSITQEHDDQLERQYSEMREAQLEAMLAASEVA